MREGDPSTDLVRRAQEASETYERNVALRTLVLAIPGIGGSLDLVLTSGGARFEERMRDLIDALKEDMQECMETVADSALDKEYLESDEFFDLVLRALDATIKTRDEAKRRMYARILTESTFLSQREGHSPEEYLELIVDLTPRELMVAQALYREWPRRVGDNEGRGDPEGWKRWQDRVRAEVGLDGTDLQLILGRLRSSGLATEVLGTVRSTPQPDDLPEYWVAPSFEKLMQFLERRDQALDSR
jgi:hypothetical protein